MFYAEIQDIDSTDTLRVKNFNEITLSRTISEINVFYTETQDGCQKWQEINFWKNSPVDSGGQKFNEIDLSRTVSKINAFMRFMQKCKMAAKIAGKQFLG